MRSTPPHAAVRLLFILLVGLPTVSLANECEPILTKGFTKYELETESEVRRAFYLMLEMSEQELDELSNKKSKGDSLSGAYKAIEAAWSSNRQSESFKRRYREAKRRFEAGQVVDDHYYTFFKSQTVSDTRSKQYKDCIELQLNTRVRLKELDKFEGGIVKEILGDPRTGTFSLVIHKIPSSGSAGKATVSSVVLVNLALDSALNLRSGVEIENYTGLTQPLRVIDATRPASIVINIEGHKPVSHEIKAQGIGSTPVGTVVASVLNFNQFSRETDNTSKGSFDPKTSLWAPADGRSVVGSDFAAFHSNVPDLRGQFLRGANQFFSPGEPKNPQNGRDTSPRSDRGGYSYQSPHTWLPPGLAVSGHVDDRFVTSIHGKNYVSRGHENNNKTRGVPPEGWSGWVESGEGGDGSNQYGVRLQGQTRKTDVRAKVVGGESETVPRNVAVHYYIRINR